MQIKITPILIVRIMHTKIGITRIINLNPNIISLLKRMMYKLENIRIKDQKEDIINILKEMLQMIIDLILMLMKIENQIILLNLIQFRVQIVELNNILETFLKTMLLTPLDNIINNHNIKMIFIKVKLAKNMI